MSGHLNIASRLPALLARLRLALALLATLAVAAKIGGAVLTGSAAQGRERVLLPAVAFVIDHADLLAALSLLPLLLLARQNRHRCGVLLLAVGWLGTTTALAQPGEINRVRLPDGRTFMLAVEPVASDIAYSLWVADTPGSDVFREVPGAGLTSSEDGSWIDAPTLVVAPSGRHLAIRRGGIWTDCLDLAADVHPCAGTAGQPGWQRPESWIERSREIERLAALSPGSAGVPDQGEVRLKP